MFCQPKDRTQEIIPLRAVDPAESENQRGSETGSDALFACGFGSPVDVQRRSRILFTVGLGFSSVEYLVCRVMDQEGVQSVSFLGQYHGSHRIESEARIPVTLGGVDIAERRRIDDDIWFCIPYEPSYLFFPGQVELPTSGRNNLRCVLAKLTE